MEALSSSFLPCYQLPLRPVAATFSANAPPLLSISAVKIDEISSPTKARLKPMPPKEKTVTTRRAPSPLSLLAMAFCNAMDHLINNFIDRPVLRPCVDPRHVLSGNFAPVAELPPTPCPVVFGSIPPCLGGGAYVRNGPNPQLHLACRTHHFFDGDGMLHSLLLPEGGGTAPAIFSSRFVRTYKYHLEHDARTAVIPNFFAGFHGIAGVGRAAVFAIRSLTGQLDLREGVGLANTSVAFLAGRLYALAESDCPYEVQLSPKDGDISTLGRCDFDGRLLTRMTSHPKKDLSTGEVFAFRYSLTPPFLTYFRFDGDGNKLPDVAIFSARDPSVVHDFAITQRYALFMENQIVIKPMNMVLGGGSAVGLDMGKMPRLGLLPRYATSQSEMRWFDVPGFNMIHTINAWEENDGDTVVLVSTNALSIQHVLDRVELIHMCVEMVRVDLRIGVVSRTPLSAGSLDFGAIHPGYVGRRNRYAYLGCGLGDPKLKSKISGVVKLDFEKAGSGDCVVASRYFGPGRFGGEPFFVPAVAGDDGRCSGQEDEGYLVTYVHDEGSGESTFVVMDARSPELEVVAEILLPRRVPYGLHGLFLTEADLRSQCSLTLSSSL